MKMLQVRHYGDTHRTRLDWFVSWTIKFVPKRGKRPETWLVTMNFLQPGTFSDFKPGDPELRWVQQYFEFDSEAEALSAVSVVELT